MNRIGWSYIIVLLCGLLLAGALIAGEVSSDNSLARYPSPAAMFQEIHDLAAAHPDRVQVTEYGKSVEGRPLLVMFIHRPGDNTKPAAFVGGNIHGNEWIGNRMAMAMARLLVEADGQDPLVTQALAALDFYIAPSLNPDGYAHTAEFPHPENLPELGKNRKNARGVDLNRNFPLPGKRLIPIAAAGSPKPESVNYRGPEPLSEPETKFLDLFFQAHPEIVAAISWHAYASVMYPAHCPSRECIQRFKKMCRAFKTVQPSVKYPRMQSRWLDTYTGEMEDWLYAQYGIMAADIEIGNSKANKKACNCKDYFWLYNPKNPDYWIENDAKAGLSALLEADRVLGGKPVPKVSR